MGRLSSKDKQANRKDPSFERVVFLHFLLLLGAPFTVSGWSMLSDIVL